jgi:DNA helicase-2/ATP-dependent DNA helicase PcrA
VYNSLLHNIRASHLNEQQQKAVLTTQGKILILAGAGSGKTSTLSYRIAHLVSNCQTAPSQILGLTFTNKAAEEMSERLAKILGKEQSKQVLLCTFHSFCMQVLREHITKLGYTKKFSLYDEYDIKRLTQQIARSLLEHEGKLPSLQSSIDLLKHLHHKGLEASDYNSYESTWHQQFIQDLHTNLQTTMRAYNAVDFDSLISLTVLLFTNFPEVLALYQERFKYIMIDEYQDTNPLQYKLASLLSAKYKNLCVVGDDDQSIYGWRGAEVKHILEFDCDILIKLEENYRSSKNILAAANAVIKNNTTRHDKTLWSQHRHEHPIYVFHAPSEQEEAQAVVDRIVALKTKHGYRWKDFAILYRSNGLARPFELALMQSSWKDHDGWRRGIPYEVFGGEELYQKSEIKDILAYLKVICNPKDQEALLRIINYPRRGIAEKTLDLLTCFNRQHHVPLWNVLENIAADHPDYQELIYRLPSKAFENIGKFVKLIQSFAEKFQTIPLHEALSSLVENISYKQAIEDEVKSEKMQSFKWKNIEEMILLLKSYEETEGSAKTLEEFLSTTLLDEKKFTKYNPSFEDHVHLLTFHSAKGLEYPICFLVGLEDHLIPHEKSLVETGLEEERRLMYVAITRCKERLFMSMARTRKKHGKDVSSTPSRFLFEIPQELLTLTSWKDSI